MNFPSINWSLCSLEVLITLTIVVLVLVDIFLPKQERHDRLGLISFAALGGMFAYWLTTGVGLGGETFGRMFVMDNLAWFYKAFFLTAMFFILVITQQYFKPLDPERRNEFYLLLWVALLGMCLIASCADFLMLFIAIEIMTLSFYVMTAYLKSDRHSIEAGMKYLILGSLASGFFLYGLSFVYGAAYSTNFADVQQYVLTHPAIPPMVLFSMVLMFATVGFKIAAVPFHMWVPDVYQGAPTPVTAFLSVGSKAAGFVVLIRVFLCVFAGWHFHWGPVFAILAAITMTYGNLVAMSQTNIKRMLGYSSIGHAGYLLMGAAAGSVLGVAAMNYYLLGYLFTNLAAFLVIVLVSNATKSESLNAYNGLAKRSSVLAFVLLLALVSLAGMPPLAGFFGKFSLLMATMQAGYTWLALVAAVNIVISLYFYMNVARRIYVDAPGSTDIIHVSRPVQVTLALAVIGIIALGIFQGPFLDAAITAVKGLPLPN